MDFAINWSWRRSGRSRHFRPRHGSGYHFRYGLRHCRRLCLNASAFLRLLALRYLPSFSKSTTVADYGALRLPALLSIIVRAAVLIYAHRFLSLSTRTPSSLLQLLPDIASPIHGVQYTVL